jgi:Ca2+-binding RTX toxin-like protein
VRPRAGIAALVAATGLAVAGQAHAATVSGEDDFFDGSIVVYRAAAGELNDVTATGDETTVTFEETGAPLVAGAGCTQVAPDRARCPHLGFVTVRLGDGDDRYALAPQSTVGAGVLGEAGADELAGVGGVSESLAGGPGDDRVSGGAGGDAPPLQPCTSPITGCSASGGDWLYGDEGDDVLVGGGSEDSLDGGPGDDDLRGGGAHDLLYGDGHAAASGGADVLDGGSGSDAIDAGPGSDELRTADLSADHADCGAGDDALSADLQDEAVDCEQVVRCGVGGAVDGVLPGAIDCVRGALES